MNNIDVLLNLKGNGNETNLGIISYIKNIVSTEWVKETSGTYVGYYKLNLNHNLKSENLSVILYEENCPAMEVFNIVDENNIVLYSENNINGKVIIFIVGENGMVSSEAQILDSLNSTSMIDGLSANKGKELNDKITVVNTQLNNMKYYLSPEMFGAVGDANITTCTGTDDTVAILNCIAQAKSLRVPIMLSKKYYITQPLFIDFGINIIGGGNDSTYIVTDKDIKIFDLSTDVAKSGVYISGLHLKGTSQLNQIGFDLMYVTNGSKIENVRMSNLGTGLKIRKSWYTTFNNIRMAVMKNVGIDMVSVDSVNQVNNITFMGVNINLSNQCINATNTQLASGINFIGCSFETSTLTACKFVNFRGLTLQGCYFENNMNSSTVLTLDNPIDIYIGGSGVNTTYNITGCFFSRKSDFASSTNKTSIYCTTYTNGSIQTNFFKCSSSSYIDYNVYSDSSLPIEYIKNSNDGVPLKEYEGKIRKRILAFKENINLNSAANSTIFFPNDLSNTLFYVSFIPNVDLTSTTAPTLRIFDGITGTTLQNISFNGTTNFTNGTEIVGVTGGIINTTSQILKLSTNQSASSTLTGYLTVYAIDNVKK